MKQRTYKIESREEFDAMIEELAADEDRLTAHESLLVTFYPADTDDARIREIAERLDAALEGTHVIGMSTVYTLGPQYILEHRITCTLLTFDTCDLVIKAYDIDQTTMTEAAEDLVAELRTERYLKGVLCLSSTLQRSMLPFLHPVVDALDVPVFGGIAGIHSGKDPGLWVFDGSDVYGDGIVAVAFCGKEFEVFTDDNMAWHPIGKQMVITDTFGEEEMVVTSIDGQPAASVYEKYLDVAPDESFVENVCAFPFLVDTGDHYVARVPMLATSDGSLTFSVPMPRGLKVTLSYAKEEYLLREANTSANDAARFQAEALLLFPCINRRIFMGNEPADREIGYFARNNPELAFGCGCGEILMTPEGGSVLNSSLISIGMREGPLDESIPFEPYIDPLLDQDTQDVVPLVERLATFLEAVTYDLDELASKDQLTGLDNRRRFEEHLQHKMTRRHGKGLYMIMYDIDHFKEINDTYGHSVGDVVLRKLTECVLGVLRPKDIIGRWGGEEFVGVFECENLDDALAIAERIRTHVDYHEFETVGHLTISLGVTAVAEDDTPDTLFNRVDSALYASKTTGRNRVTAL